MHKHHFKLEKTFYKGGPVRDVKGVGQQDAPGRRRVRPEVDAPRPPAGLRGPLPGALAARPQEGGRAHAQGQGREPHRETI